MKGIQDTSSNTFRQLLGNGLRYEVPKFQRDYSWENEQWDDLWQDIEMLDKGEESAHYMGYLVFQTRNDKNFKVIDGQQRMITLSLLILAAVKVLNNLEESGELTKNKQRANSFRNSYLGYLDPVSLVSSNKLKLNRNNDDFYRQKLITLEKMPQRGLNVSEKLMKNCFIWFHDKLKKKYNLGRTLAEYIDKLVDRLFFTVITVTDELNAFKVFETLNARGVQLSAADMLKNYLFSVVDSGGSHPSEIREIDLLWGQIIAKLGNQKFSDFLRIYWNSEHKTIRKSNLFKVIRKNITSKAMTFELLRALNDEADTFIALRNPDDEMWHNQPEVRPYLTELKLFQVKQPLSLLLAAHRYLDKKQFYKVLKTCSIVSFRYNIIGGLNPNEQEKAYNNAVLNIKNNKTFDLSIINDIYPNDNQFQAEFSNKSFKRTSKNHKIVQYILAKIEKHLYQTDINLASDTYTVEHILPESPQEGDWDDFSDNALERCVYRLGNLTILEKKLNKKAGILPYIEKAKIYQESTIKINQKLVEYYESWTEGKINDRQSFLAKKAKEIWRI